MNYKPKLESGAQLGRWTLLTRLGHGGNGFVWLAEDKAHTRAAIKFLQDRHLNNSKRLERFRIEIEFLIRKEGARGILPIIDHHPPDERPWFSTPFCEALTEAQRANFSLERAVRDVADLTQALADLHDEGVTHRDIKPDNLFWLEETPILGDFGLVDFPEKPALTGKSELLGPIMYMAPEMREGADDIDARPADVYSLGKVLWVLATQQKFPIPGEQRVATSSQLLSAYISHSKTRTLDFLIDRATRYESSERPTMREFASELLLWLKPSLTPSANPETDWTAAGELIRRAKARDDEEAAGRARETSMTRDIQPEIQRRVERIMSDCTARLGYSLGGGGLNTPLMPCPQATKHVARASVNLSVPGHPMGTLIGAIEVNRTDDNTLYLQGIVATKTAHVTNILWSREANAPLGSVAYDHAMDQLTADLEYEFKSAINHYASGLQ